MLDYVWMVEHSQHFDLPLDLFKDSLLLDFLLVQYLDCDFVACYLILSNYWNY